VREWVASRFNSVQCTNPDATSSNESRNQMQKYKQYYSIQNAHFESPINEISDYRFRSARCTTSIDKSDFKTAQEAKLYVKQ